MLRKKISQRDLAKKLNLSQTTVSAVLNNQTKKFRISEKTKEKILKTAKETGYYSDEIARSLRLGITKTIGLIVPNIADPFFGEISYYIEKFAHQKGYNVLFCSSEDQYEKEVIYLNIFKGRKVDGIILVPAQQNVQDILQLKKEGYPFVLIDRCFPRIKTNYVIVDNEKGAFLATQHLIKLGYKKIAYLSGPDHIFTIAQRFKGFKRALKKYSINFDKNLFRAIKEINEVEAYKMAAELLENKPEAIFTYNDLTTIGALRYIREKKIVIPDDLALISFDDLEEWFPPLSPPLTAVRQPTKQIAQKSIEILLEAISSKKANFCKEIVLSPQLIVRESCGEKKF